MDNIQTGKRRSFKWQENHEHQAIETLRRYHEGEGEVSPEETLAELFAIGSIVDACQDDNDQEPQTQPVETSVGQQEQQQS